MPSRATPRLGGECQGIEVLLTVDWTTTHGLFVPNAVLRCRGVPADVVVLVTVSFRASVGRLMVGRSMPF